MIVLAQIPDPAVGAIQLSALDVVLAALLVLVPGALSIALRLRLEWQLALAAVRTVAQLLLVGLVLRWIFHIENVWLVLAYAIFMILAAGHAALQRSSRRVDGAHWRSWLSLTISGLCTTILATAVIIGVQPWYEPQYFIPILGMVLGNSLTGISLCMDTFLERLDERADEVDMHLSLGATKWEAASRPMIESVRRGMIPTINAMMVVGLVSLPGMMTGQILAGADPFHAVLYQILIMFMLAAATSSGCMLMALLLYRRVFTARHQLDRAAIQRRRA